MSTDAVSSKFLKTNNDLCVNSKLAVSLNNQSNGDNKQQSEINFTISNVVCSYSTRCHLNLRKIAMEAMHVEYRKENGMINMKIRSPFTTASIWSSGKITCTGAKSETDAYKAARRYCRLLQKLGFKVKLCNYRVVNVLATSSFGCQTDIVKLANDYPKECSYEPELHPGATFTIPDIKTTLKIYSTGSITLTAPSVKYIPTAITKIFGILNNYRIEKLSNTENINESKTLEVNNILVNNGYGNSVNTNINLALNKTQVTCLLQPNNFLSQAISFGNNNMNNVCNIVHANNNTRHKSFFIDEIDEEFLP